MEMDLFSSVRVVTGAAPSIERPKGLLLVDDGVEALPIKSLFTRALDQKRKKRTAMLCEPNIMLIKSRHLNHAWH
jgi:hypothetical protein